MDDPVNSLNWSNYEDYPEYNFYNTYATSGGIDDPIGAACGNNLSVPSAPCTVSVRFEIDPASLIGEVRQSRPGISRVDAILLEGAIVGGVAFLSGFISLWAL